MVTAEGLQSVSFSPQFNTPVILDGSEPVVLRYETHFPGVVGIRLVRQYAEVGDGVEVGLRFAQFIETGCGFGCGTGFGNGGGTTTGADFTGFDGGNGCTG